MAVGGGGMETPMTDGSSRKESIQEVIRALAGCAGVDPGQLTFKWEELQGLEKPGSDSPPHDKVQSVRVYLNKSWSTLIFTDSELRNAAHIPEQILAAHKHDILEVLRRLKGLCRPISESECPDRWIAEGDSFPGEIV